MTKRLKLISVQEKDASGNSLPPYKFAYNNEENTSPIPIPCKTSFAKDHWGYYNGKVSNASLIPDFINNVSPDIIALYLGVMGENRDTDPAFAQLFSLKQIIYPTGGKTMFEYESHDFDIIKSKVNDYSYFKDYKEVIGKTIRKFYPTVLNQEQPTAANTASYILDLQDLYIDNTNSYPFPAYSSKVNLQAFFRYNGSSQSVCLPSGAATITLTKEDGTVISGPSDVSFFIGAPTEPKTVCAGDGNGVYYSATFNNTYNLPPGRYLWKVLITSGFIEDVSLTVNYKAIREKQSIQNSGDVLTGADFAGGLRIKRVIDYDNINDSKPKIRRYYYHYTDEQGLIHSYGRRMSRPIYSYYKEENTIQPDIFTNEQVQSHVNKLIRESDSNIPLNGHLSGYAVGYDKVTIFNGENGENGKTVIDYENDPDIIFDFSEIQPVQGSYTRIPRKTPSLGTIPNESNGNIIVQTDYKNEAGNFVPVKEITNTDH